MEYFENILLLKEKNIFLRKQKTFESCFFWIFDKCLWFL